MKLDLWLCQSAVAHLLRSEDGEQLKAGQNCHRAPTTPDAPETLLLRRSFCGVICVTATTPIVFLRPPLVSEFPALIISLLLVAEDLVTKLQRFSPHCNALCLINCSESLDSPEKQHRRSLSIVVHCCPFGRDNPTKMDEFSEKFQTAFDPPPSFSENHIAIISE